MNRNSSQLRMWLEKQQFPIRAQVLRVHVSTQGQWVQTISVNMETTLNNCFSKTIIISILGKYGVKYMYAAVYIYVVQLKVGKCHISLLVHSQHAVTEFPFSIKKRTQTCWGQGVLHKRSDETIVFQKKSNIITGEKRYAWNFKAKWDFSQFEFAWKRGN